MSPEPEDGPPIDHAALLDAAADPIVLYREDRLLYVNDAFRDLLGYGRAALTDVPASELLHAGDRERVREYQYYRYDREGPAPTRFEARVVGRDDTVHVCEFRVRVVDLADGPATLAVVREVTERARRERELERRREELRSLATLNDLLLSVTRAIVRTPEREAVERTVCERFSDADRYECAWVWDLDAETLRAAAGIDAGTVERLRDGAGPIGAPEGPGARAARDGEIRIERDVPSPVDGTGEGTLGAIPVGGEGVIHGVLVVYADRLDALRADERAALAVFGETVGFVLTAIENRNLLVANAPTELVCRVEDGTAPIVRAARRLDAALTLQGYVAVDPDTHLWYVRVEDPTVDADGLLADDAIEAVRTIAADDDRRFIELTVVGESFARTAIECGARVVSGRSADGGVRFTMEVADSTPAKAVLRRLRSAYPSMAVLARRSQAPDVRTERDLRASLRERLTEHQWIALRTAYLAGYFEWPRDSAGEAVADTLGVSSPTFHHHLRNGTRRVLDVIFDGATTVIAGDR